MEIIPAVIPESFGHLRGEVLKVAPYVSRVQIDVMDGLYTPEPSWPYSRREKEKKERELPHVGTLAYEVDMMVLRPEDHVGGWLAAGASAVIVHLESTKKMDAVIDMVRGAEAELGIAFQPRNSPQLLSEWISKADFVQCMGSDTIGFHGVSLDERVFGHLRWLREHYPSIILSVDIGVSLDTAPKLIEAGANKLVSGSAIFNSGDIEKTIRRFQNMN